MKQRYICLSDNQYICDRAVMDCFKGKWSRNDILTHIEKYAGIPRHEILLHDLEIRQDRESRLDHSAKADAVTSCALALSEMIDEIMHGVEPDDMEPVRIRKRPDGMTGKVRDIALLCIPHQLVEHVAYILLEPFFKQKLYPTQHASIPKHGQTKLKDQVSRKLRRKLGIKYAQKTDMVHAYESVKYDKVLGLIKADIPSAHEIHVLIEFLGNHAPDGHLIIGGYLDAWLFNYVMSKVITAAYSVGTYRRGKFNRHAISLQAFMDDMLILSGSAKGIKAVIKYTGHYARDKLSMEMRVTTGIYKLLPVEEERRRKALKTKAARGCPVIDMAGYKIAKGHICIRRKIFIRIRRQFLRAWRDYKRRGTVTLQRACKLISYNGFIRQSDSQGLIRRYHVPELMRLARRIVSFYGRLINRRRWEKLYDLQKRTEQYKARLGDGRGSSGWPAENYHYQKYFGSIKRRWGPVPV